MHCVLLMLLSAATAQAYAEKCIFEHSGTKGLGENLATGYKDWTTAVKVWYDEEKLYDYNAGQFSHETGHFTAMGACLLMGVLADGLLSCCLATVKSPLAMP